MNQLMNYIIHIPTCAGSESPKKLVQDKGGAPPSNLAGGGGAESQLKYENDRLKLALAQSSANAKVCGWDIAFFIILILEGDVEVCPFSYFIVALVESIFGLILGMLILIGSMHVPTILTFIV